MKLCFGLFLLLVSMNVHSLGNPNAPKGGNWKYNIGQEPTTLNPLSSTDAYASVVQAYIVDSLLIKDYETDEWLPSLAKEWKVSKDGMEFEFTLREGATFHDGKPVTVEDVKFTFDAITDKDNKYSTAHLKPYYENIKGCEIIAKDKIKFTVSKLYFQNFDIVAGLEVLPKHIYANTDKENLKKLNKTIIGSGPYTFGELKKGKHVTLEKNKSWWGNNVPAMNGKYNFDKITMRFIQDSTTSIQSMEKGVIDFYALDPEEYYSKTKGGKWGKEIKKLEYKNDAPNGYAFIAWNLDNDLFKSKRVRRALAHLVNREGMIKSYLYEASEPATGPLYKQSIYAAKDVQPIPYDPKEALKMLREEGWKDTDGDNVLDKMIDGKKVRLSFTILEPNNDFMKYLTTFQQDAKAAGVEVNIKYVEWNSFVKLLDERKFEAVRLAWSAGGSNWDPKQIWHSESTGNAGSNFINYKNPKVDKLIDEARVIMEKEKRALALQEVYRQIADDAPYVFLFNKTKSFYGYNAKIGFEKPTYRYSVGTAYWWFEK